MPLYRFDIRNGNGLIEDDEGRELPDAAAARNEAVKGIRSILAEDVLHGQLDLRGRIEVRDEAGGPLFAVCYAEALLIDAPDQIAKPVNPHH